MDCQYGLPLWIVSMDMDSRSQKHNIVGVGDKLQETASILILLIKVYNLTKIILPVGNDKRQNVLSIRIVMFRRAWDGMGLNWDINNATVPV